MTACFAPTAVAVVWAVLNQCDGAPGRVSKVHEVHDSREHFAQMAEEAETMAGVASGWSGYRIPPELAWVTMLAEGSGHNLNRDAVADIWHRSTGFFSMRPNTYAKFSRRADVPYPTRELFGSDAEWVAEVCAFNRDHPIYQVRVYFAGAAFYLRQQQGSVVDFFSIWRYGSPGRTDYSDACEKLWTAKFGTYPKDGRLTPLRARR